MGHGLIWSTIYSINPGRFDVFKIKKLTLFLNILKAFGQTLHQKVSNPGKNIF